MKNKLEEAILDSMSSNPNNWKGIFYYNPRDPRLLVPKINPLMGSSFNYAHPITYITLISIILITIDCICFFRLWCISFLKISVIIQLLSINRNYTKTNASPDAGGNQTTGLLLVIPNT
jgi:hypothetical protein